MDDSDIDMSMEDGGGNGSISLSGDGGSSSLQNCTLFQNSHCEPQEDYEEEILAYIYPDHYEWALIAAHFLVFIIGLVGNALVCVAVWRNTSMRTVTNYFIVNLAVADFLVILVCLPPTVIWDVTNTWFLGEALCKIVLYFQTVSVSVSVLTLTVISVERWYAICYPLKFKATTSRAKRLILLIWAISLIVDIPELIVLETIPSNVTTSTIYFTDCGPNWSNEVDMVYIILRVLILYAVPLMFMSVTYYQIVRVLWSTDIPGDRREMPDVQLRSNQHNNHSHSQHLSTPQQQSGQQGNTGNGVTHHHVNGQYNAQLLTPVIRGVPASHCSQADYQLKSRRKAAKMLVAVVIMFAMCYFPVHYYSIFALTGFEINHEYMTYFAMISHWLCYFNSAINPLIYNFMSGKFRREFSRAFQCICSKNQYSPATSRVYTYNLHHRTMNHHNNHQRAATRHQQAVMDPLIHSFSYLFPPLSQLGTKKSRTFFKLMSACRLYVFGTRTSLHCKINT